MASMSPASKVEPMARMAWNPSVLHKRRPPRRPVCPAGGRRRDRSSRNRHATKATTNRQDCRCPPRKASAVKATEARSKTLPLRPALRTAHAIHGNQQVVPSTQRW